MVDPPHVLRPICYPWRVLVPPRPRSDSELLGDGGRRWHGRLADGDARADLVLVQLDGGQHQLEVLDRDALHQGEEVAHEADVLARARLQLDARQQVRPVPVSLGLVVVLVDDHLPSVSSRPSTSATTRHLRTPTHRTQQPPSEARFQRIVAPHLLGRVEVVVRDGLVGLEVLERLHARIQHLTDQDRSTDQHPKLHQPVRALEKCARGEGWGSR